MIMIEALAPVEQTGRKDSPDATEAMNWACIHRVINLQELEEHGRALVHEGPDQTNGKGTAALDIAAGRCDGHQPREDAVAKATHLKKKRKKGYVKRQDSANRCFEGARQHETDMPIYELEKGCGTLVAGFGALVVCCSCMWPKTGK